MIDKIFFFHNLKAGGTSLRLIIAGLCEEGVVGSLAFLSAPDQPFRLDQWRAFDLDGSWAGARFGSNGKLSPEEALREAQANMLHR